MTELAILAEHLSFPADVISIVATETAGKYSMADVVGMSAPVDFHLRKDIAPIDLLHLGDGLLDCFSLPWIYLGILFHVEAIQGCRDTFSSLFLALIVLAQSAYRFSLDIRQVPVDEPTEKSRPMAMKARTQTSTGRQ